MSPLPLIEQAVSSGDLTRFGEHMNVLYGHRRKKYDRGQSIGLLCLPV